MKSQRTALYCALSIAILVIFGCTFSGCTGQETKTLIENKENDVLFQASSIDILLNGGYDGFVTIKELKKLGDTGIGTPDMLDGELIAIDGMYYSIKSDGAAYLLSDDVKVPFACVTFYEEDMSAEISDINNISEFEDILEEIIPSDNLFYAVRLDATIPYLKTRAVPLQKKPYIRLIDVIENQSVFEFYNITGTVIGFWSPQFSEGANIPGLHIHFISDDRTKGGHILNFSIDNAVLKLDKTHVYTVLPPETDLGGVSGNLKKSSTDNSELAIIEK